MTVFVIVVSLKNGKKINRSNRIYNQKGGKLMTCPKCGETMQFKPPPTSSGPLGTYVCPKCGLQVDKKS